MMLFKYSAAVGFLLLAAALPTQGQTALSLDQALLQGQSNYPLLKARQFGVEASRASVAQTRRDYLPNLVVSAQQSYGTVNGQNGPLYGFGGYGVSSSGLPLPEQNWNAGFGAVYLANMNWEVFSFGRSKERVHVAEAGMAVSEGDLAQEAFQHNVRVAAAYLNLLASQRMVLAQEKNLERAAIFRQTAVIRAKNGLIAGVDSSLANAEVSNAKIALIKARDAQQEEARKLAVLIGAPPTDLVADTAYVTRIPFLADTAKALEQHPLLSYYQAQVDQQQAVAKWVRRSYFPSLTLFGIIQTRGSGFEPTYAQDQTAFTTDYLTGIKPSRTNYLVGAGLVWNITSLTRVHAQAEAADYLALSAKSDYELTQQQLSSQLAINEQRYQSALQTSYEAPLQVASARDAYHQKLTLYQNGLTTMVDVTQTLYTLNRAETDRDIAYINVWQALLLRAAASGDFELFRNQIQ